MARRDSGRLRARRSSISATKDNPGRRPSRVVAAVARAGCLRTAERQYEGAEAAPFTRQLQIDCSGLQVFGAPREVEFLFNDGPLGHVWILVREEELGELRRQLENVFGPVVHETDLDLVFASGTVALRNRPPEVLVATPALVSDITGWSRDRPR